MNSIRSDDRNWLQSFLESYVIQEESAGRRARTIQMLVPAKEVILAHIIGSSFDPVYTNLAIDIGFHEGAQPYGDAIGIFKVSPHVGVIVAGDVAVKCATVDIGFMDRFKGVLILTGSRSEVETAIQNCHQYFRSELGYRCHPITHS